MTDSDRYQHNKCKNTINKDDNNLPPTFLSPSWFAEFCLIGERRFCPSPKRAALLADIRAAQGRSRSADLADRRPSRAPRRAAASLPSPGTGVCGPSGWAPRTAALTQVDEAHDHVGIAEEGAVLRGGQWRRRGRGDRKSVV